MAMTAVGGACPNCGGMLESKGQGQLVCPFCGGKFFDEKLAAIDKDTKSKPDADDDDEYLDDDVIDEIVRDAISKYASEDDYGVEISLDDEELPKEDKARDRFDIDDDDTVYLIYDDTIFGSCKNGYAITDYGLYISYPDCGNVYFAWDEFDEAEIEKGDTDSELYVDDCCMELTGGDACKNTRKLLQAIQDALIAKLDEKAK